MNDAKVMKTLHRLCDSLIQKKSASKKIKRIVGEVAHIRISGNVNHSFLRQSSVVG